jgi:hypothetical protein
MFQKELDKKANASSVAKELSAVREALEHERVRHRQEIQALRISFKEGRKKLLQEVTMMVEGKRKSPSGNSDCSGGNKKKKGEPKKKSKVFQLLLFVRIRDGYKLLIAEILTCFHTKDFFRDIGGGNDTSEVGTEEVTLYLFWQTEHYCERT